jgi:hypothetical protein
MHRFEEENPMRIRQFVPVLSLAALLLSAVMIPAGQAELKLPALSPKASVHQTIGYAEMSITFSRPGVKGRVIWGGLVPYDEMWRTGANENTVFTTSSDVMVEDVMLPAGTYSVFTIPTPEMWTVIFSKKYDHRGTGGYDEANDALRVEIKPQEAEFEERMTFQFTDLTTGGGKLVLRWEKLALPIRLETNAVEEAFANAKTAMAEVEPDDWQTPWRCASLVYHNNLNMEEGMQWVEMSTKVKSHYLNESLYAKYLASFDRYADAITHAQKAIELGKNAENPFDTRPTEKLLAEWQAEAK